jgi:hypothetical protein
MIFLVLCVIVVWLFRPVLNIVNSTCPYGQIDSKRRDIYVNRSQYYTLKNKEFRRTI